MSPTDSRHWQPVAWLPAGLITWQAPGARTYALATGWMALVGGKTPRLRAAWPGQRDPASRFWPGGPFVLNIPDSRSLKKVGQLLDQGRACLDVAGDLEMTVHPAARVPVPCLDGCSLYFECLDGRILRDNFEPEVAGEVVLLRRDGVLLDPRDVPELCAISPFSPVATAPPS